MATFPQAAKETPGARTQAEAPRILAADDQPHILDAIELLLQPEGYRVERAQSPREVRDRVASETYDALLIDLNYTRDTTSGAEGLELLAQLSAHDSRLRIIVMTAWANVDLAVESMRRGACDFIQKPWENARLISILRTQIELRRAVQQAEILEAENRLLRAEGRPELIAKASSMQPVLELLARIGPSDANVLITGEHGTGKEIVAQTLHALSSRAARSLVAVNTGALAEGTFESELFGHVKGAFTDARTDRIGRFELADRGTLFLDEIANVPHAPAGQAAARARDRRSGTGRLFANQASECASAFGYQCRPAGGVRRRDAFAKICSSASTRWKFIFPRCAIAAKIFPCLPGTSSPAILPATARLRPASSPAPWRPCSSTAGRAT